MDCFSSENKNVQEVMRKYFTQEEWSSLPEILQAKYLRTTRHYLEGDNASFLPKPDFIKDNDKPTNKKVIIQKNRKSPAPKTKRNCRAETKTKNRKSSEKKCDVNENSENVDPNSKTGGGETSNFGTKYPRRNIPTRNYFEEEEPRDDRYIYCDNCERQYVDFCTKCGMLITLESTSIPIGSQNRAMNTVPAGILEVRSSKIHGFGVFAVKELNKGIRLGPYEGFITRIESTKGYSWKLKDGRLIDASDETNSNYLRYVNCARNMSEQNLVAFQYKGDLYYRTCKDIKVDEELLVFYGNSFAQNLGIDTKKYFEPSYEEIDEIDVYKCPYCRAGLSTKDYRDTHQKQCKYNPIFLRRIADKLYTCEYCKWNFTTEEYLKKHRCRSRQKRVKINIEKEEEDPNVLEAAAVKKYSCQYCEFKTKWKSTFQRHLNVIHNREDALIYKCDKCVFQTHYKHSLISHSNVHKEMLPHQCYFCWKQFAQKQELDGHFLNHHQSSGMNLITSKIHNCELCEYRTVLSTDIKRHYIRHFKENEKHTNTIERNVENRKPSTNLTDKQNEVNNGNNLTEKIPEKFFEMERYECFECHYVTFHKSNLKRHVLLHSKIYPYKCTQCNKGFSHKQNFHNHILKKHPEDEDIRISSKIHRCNFCKYQTTMFSNLKLHLKKHLTENNTGNS